MPSFRGKFGMESRDLLRNKLITGHVSLFEITGIVFNAYKSSDANRHRSHGLTNDGAWEPAI